MHALRVYDIGGDACGLSPKLLEYSSLRRRPRCAANVVFRRRTSSRSDIREIFFAHYLRQIFERTFLRRMREDRAGFNQTIDDSRQSDILLKMERQRIRCLAFCGAFCLVLAACGTHRWERAATDPAETEAALARCIAREAENTQHVTVPVFTRTRDGRMETLFVPDRFVAPGYARDKCMRDQGFAPATNEASGPREITNSSNRPTASPTLDRPNAAAGRKSNGCASCRRD